jgi:hypothetical protein
VIVNKRCALGSRAAALGFLIAVSSAQAATFDFSYSLPSGPGPNPISVTANGVFTTSAFNGTSYTVTGITGFRNGQAITGLLAPGIFSGNDNLLFPSSPFVDNNGISFTVAGAGDDGFGDVNLFLDLTSIDPVMIYTENSSNIGDGTMTLTAVTNSVPEPSSMALAAAGLLALAYLRRRVFSTRPI